MTMRRHFWCSLFAIMSLSLPLNGLASAQTEPGASPLSPTILVRLCNQTNVNIAVALALRSDENRPQAWVIKGWWRVGPNQCVDAARAMAGPVLSYAEGGGYVWPEQVNNPKTTASVCVRYPGPFERVDTHGFICEPIRYFMRGMPERGADTYTINYQ
jgi:Protein of unknown function (DUF1036)